MKARLNSTPFILLHLFERAWEVAMQFRTGKVIYLMNPGSSNFWERRFNIPCMACLSASVNSSFFKRTSVARTYSRTNWRGSDIKHPCMERQRRFRKRCDAYFLSQTTRTRWSSAKECQSTSRSSIEKREAVSGLLSAAKRFSKEWR